MDLLFPIVITGSKSEAFQKQSVITQLTQQGAISAVGEFNLRESLALFEAAKYMVTGDTGPMHAAAALGTRVIALFGPSWPERNGPWGKGHHVIQKVSPSTHRAFKDPASVSLMQLIKPNDVIPVLKEGAL